MGLIIGLLIGGVILLLLEVFLPGMIVGAVGLILVVTAVILGFMHDRQLGTYMLMGLLILGPFALWAWIRYFPDSRFGRVLKLEENASDWRAFDETNATYTGKTGIAHTDLRPSGTAIIDGDRVDVITQSEMINRGNPIRVIAVEGNRVIVEAVKTPSA